MYVCIHNSRMMISPGMEIVSAEWLVVEVSVSAPVKRPEGGVPVYPMC